MDRGAWTAKTVKRPRQQPAQPQYANYWAPLTRKRHTMPHSAQPKHTNHWAPRTRKGHQQEHRPQRPIECSDPTQHAKGRTGDCSGPRKGATTRRNVTQGVIPPPLLLFQCLRLTAKILLRCLRCQQDLRFKIFGPPSAGIIGGPGEEGGVPAKSPCPLPPSKTSWSTSSKSAKPGQSLQTPEEVTCTSSASERTT